VNTDQNTPGGLFKNIPDRGPLSGESGGPPERRQAWLCAAFRPARRRSRSAGSPETFDRPPVSKLDGLAVTTRPPPSPAQNRRLTVPARRLPPVSRPFGSANPPSSRPGSARRPTSGTLHLDAPNCLDQRGRNAQPARAEIGFVFQAFHLLPYAPHETSCCPALHWPSAGTRSQPSRPCTGRLGHRLNALPQPVGGNANASPSPALSRLADTCCCATNHRQPRFRYRSRFMNR